MRIAAFSSQLYAQPEYHTKEKGKEKKRKEKKRAEEKKMGIRMIWRPLSCISIEQHRPQISRHLYKLLITLILFRSISITKTKHIQYSGNKNRVRCLFNGEPCWYLVWLRVLLQ